MLSPGEQSENRFVRLPEVRRRTGLSKSELYRRIRKGTFPRPNKLGYRTVAWPLAEIDRWYWETVDPSIGALLA